MTLQTGETIEERLSVAMKTYEDERRQLVGISTSVDDDEASYGPALPPSTPATGKVQRKLQIFARYYTVHTIDIAKIFTS